MNHFGNQNLAIESQAKVSSNVGRAFPIHCQVFFQIEGAESQKYAFFAKKVFYGGCMTGRSLLANDKHTA
jgi:hypothetical protein